MYHITNFVFLTDYKANQVNKDCVPRMSSFWTYWGRKYFFLNYSSYLSTYKTSFFFHQQLSFMNKWIPQITTIWLLGPVFSVQYLPIWQENRERNVLLLINGHMWGVICIAKRWPELTYTHTAHTSSIHPANVYGTLLIHWYHLIGIPIVR